MTVTRKEMNKGKFRFRKDLIIFFIFYIINDEIRNRLPKNTSEFFFELFLLKIFMRSVIHVINHLTERCKG